MFNTLYMLKTSIIRVTNVSGLGYTNLKQLGRQDKRKCSTTYVPQEVLPAFETLG
jgi:hypothetical protein